VLRVVAGAEGAPCAVTTHVADGGAGALGVARAGLERYTKLGMPPCRPSSSRLACRQHAYRKARTRGSPAYRVRGGSQCVRCAWPQAPSIEDDDHASTRLARHVCAISGDLQTMPGRGRTPSAAGIDLLAAGTIVGLR
jgi:hypothetical protein